MPDLLTAPKAAEAEPLPKGGSEVTGLGVSLPETVVGNAAIGERLGVEESWIEQRTGIRERRVAAPEERLSDFAAAAGKRALADAELSGDQVDLVVVATTTNEQLMPAVANRVTTAVGATAAGACDVASACTGFLSALSLACAQVEAGRARRVLVVGADLMTRLTDPDDRSTAALFADGAGAVVVQSSPEGRVGPITMGSDGANAHLIYADREEALIRMRGHETFRHAVARMAEATVQALRLAKLSTDDVDLFVYHQANARILRAVGERLGLRGDRVVDCIGRLGNTSAASIPLALDHARGAGALQPGSLILLGAFGAGLGWAAGTLTWGGSW